MKRALAIVLFGLMWAAPSWGQADPGTNNQWNYPGAATYEGIPQGTESLGFADERQRDVKEEVRGRAEAEHCWGNTNTGCAGSNTQDNGRHREGTARAFVENAEPVGTVVNDYDFAGGAGSAALDQGRIWVDSNSATGNGHLGSTTGWNRTTFYDGTGFDDIFIDDEILAGAYNLVYNGSFEATDGDGDVAATTTPQGWTDGDADCADVYRASTDIDYGSGFEYECTAAGADSEIEQTLTNLAANRWYKVVARVQDDGVNDCELDVTGETGTAFTMVDTSATHGVWVTLEGTFQTGVALESPAVVLNTETGGGVCLWDHVAVYPTDFDPAALADRSEISEPGALSMYVSDTANVVNVPAAFGQYAALGNLQFTPPTPGWSIQVGYSVSAGRDNNLFVLGCRLMEGVGVVTGTVTQCQNNAIVGTILEGACSLSTTYVLPNATAGTTYDFSVQCFADPAGVVLYNELGTQSNFWLMANPTR